MSFGPLELVSLATPAGPPLRLAITYNSRNQLTSAAGVGWTFNIEQRVERTPRGFTYWGATHRPMPFRAPAQAAADEWRALAFPNAAYVSRALDGANAGLYLASMGPGGILLEPRVVSGDGSTTLFDSTGTLTGFRDVAGNVQAYARLVTSGGYTDTLSQGNRSLTYERSDRPQPGAYSRNRVTAHVAGIVPLTGVDVVVAELLRDSSDYLTDICAPLDRKPLNHCRRTGEALSPCEAIGQRTLWRFNYVLVAGCTGNFCSARLSEVMDESCTVVETHEYQRVAGLGTVATSSFTGTEQLRLVYAASGTWVDSVTTTTYLKPASATTSSEPPSVDSTTLLDSTTHLVRRVPDTCACSAVAERMYVTDIDGRPRIAQLSSGLTSARYDVEPAADPYGYGQTTRRTAVAAGLPDKVTSFRYLHPLIRRPTDINEPGVGGAPKTTRYDYADDDAAHPCRVGLVPTDSTPTRFLCHVLETGNTGRRMTHFQYDSIGRVVQSIEEAEPAATPLGGGPPPIVTTYSYYPDYDANQLRAGLLASVTRSAGGASLRTSW